MNTINVKTTTGTVGELLVMLRFLQYAVQAAPPIKDSGNDLIAVLGNEFRAIQIKTTTKKYFNLHKLRTDRLKKYHICACVHLVLQENGYEYDLEKTKIFLLERETLTHPDLRRFTVANFSRLGFEMNQDRVNRLFRGQGETEIEHTLAEDNGKVVSHREFTDSGRQIRRRVPARQISDETASVADYVFEDHSSEFADKK